MIDGYFQALQNLIASVPFITAVNLHTERRTEMIGFVRGDLTFEDGSRLHFREFVRGTLYIRLPLSIAGWGSRFSLRQHEPLSRPGERPSP